MRLDQIDKFVVESGFYGDRAIIIDTIISRCGKRSATANEIVETRHFGNYEDLIMLIQASKSELTIRVETTIDGRVIATSIDLPDLQSQAASRAEALSDLETKIRARLVTTEIVTLQWDAKPTSNPWLDIAGKYATDPEFDRMLAHIKAERESIDHDESKRVFEKGGMR